RVVRLRQPQPSRPGDSRVRQDRPRGNVQPHARVRPRRRQPGRHGRHDRGRQGARGHGRRPVPGTRPLARRHGGVPRRRPDLAPVPTLRGGPMHRSAHDTFRRSRRRAARFALALLTALALGMSAHAQSTLTVAQTVDIPGFDPHDHGSTAVEAVLTNVFDYLLFRDANGDIQPALATGYEQVDDLTWRFTLREGVTWHDGEPFTAADVEFSLERVAKDDTLFEHDSFRQIGDVEVVNDHEVLLHTEGPDPVLLSRISRKGAAIVPKHVIDAIGWDGFSVAP